MAAPADAMPDRYRALVWFTAGTGLRKGEVFGLTLDRVDLLRRVVTVDRQLDPAGSGGFAPPKTAASYRSVPLAQVTFGGIAAHLATYPAGEEGLVFTDGKGQPLRRNRFGELWRRARAKVGVEHVTMHDLRHFYASLLIRHGESVKTVQARLGHASASETLDTYSHLWPDSEDRTRSAVEEVLGGLGAPSAESRLSPGATG